MLIMTYGALLSLAILRDPFTNLDRPGLVKFLRTCQQDDGRFRVPPSIHREHVLTFSNSFILYPGNDERDLRMTYCAFAICALLGDWSAIDIPKAIGFVQKCRVSTLHLSPLNTIH